MPVASLTPAELAELTPAERAALPAGAVTTVTGTQPKDLAKHQHAGVLPMTTSCAWYQYTVYEHNATGANIWRFALRVDWCYNGSRVVSISPPQVSAYVYGWAAAAGWSYGGLQHTSQWDYFGDRWVYRTYVQGKFAYCPPRIWCFQTKYPYVYLDTYGNGNAGVPPGGWGGA